MREERAIVIEVLTVWVFPLLGIALSTAGVYFSVLAFRAAESARKAATDARDAAIRAQLELTAHRELLPLLQRLDTMLKAFVEEITVGSAVPMRSNEVIDQLSKVSHMAVALQKPEIGEILSRAHDVIATGEVTRESALSARNLLNEADAKLRYDAGSMRALSGGQSG